MTLAQDWRLPFWHRLFFVVCLGTATLAVMGRALHYATIYMPFPQDWFFGQVIGLGITSQSLATILATVVGVVLTGALSFGPWSLPVLLLILIVGQWWKNWFVIRELGRLGTRPWLHSVIWFFVLSLNALLDIEQYIWLAVWSTLPLIWPAFWRRMGIDPDLGGWRWYFAAFLLPPTFCAAWAWGAPDPHIHGAIVFWAVALVILVVLGTRRLFARDRLWLAAVASMIAQLSSTVPATATPAGGTMLGDNGYAYTFCELPERNKLYVAVPCDWAYFVSGKPDDVPEDEICKYGYVAEHDLDNLQAVKKHTFFDDNFNGRLVRLACTPESIQVSMVHSTIAGVDYPENILAFQVDDPTQFDRALMKNNVGNCAVYDKKHNAVFYTSEHREHIYRRDLKTGAVNAGIAVGLYDRPVHPNQYGSHHVNANGLHEGRDSIFFGQWATGSKIFEVNRTTLEPMEFYDPRNGGNHGIAVDDELNRLWATSPWGVDVLEIPSGEVLARIRLSGAIRNSSISRQYDLAFVPSTFTGRVWVIDRRSLEVLGNLPVGVEGRHVTVSVDGERLYASNALGYFVWDIKAVARQMRNVGG